jgi:pyruvate formate lyase activating enzyme
MKFCGLQKTSLVDFPDRIASILFTPGCNLRCPYCHNWRIVVDPRPPFLNEEDAISLLETRKRYVDAIVVTGGEPTLHRELPKFLKKLKEKGFAVKIDTNGFNPQVLEECLPRADYVALDVKTSIEKYPLLGAKDTTGFLKTVEMLKNGKVEYEFRTTLVPGFVDESDIPGICELVKGARKFVMQQFVPEDTLDAGFATLKPHSADIIAGYVEKIKGVADEIILRI